MTAVCGVLGPGEGRLDYVNCGHNPPLLLRGGGAPSRSPAAGRRSASSARRRSRPGRVALEPGDRLVLYTDGVVEPTDGEDREFGTERLATAVREATGRPPRRPSAA